MCSWFQLQQFEEVKEMTSKDKIVEKLQNLRTKDGNEIEGLDVTSRTFAFLKGRIQAFDDAIKYILLEMGGGYIMPIPTGPEPRTEDKEEVDFVELQEEVNDWWDGLTWKQKYHRYCDDKGIDY